MRVACAVAKRRLPMTQARGRETHVPDPHRIREARYIVRSYDFTRPSSVRSDIVHCVTDSVGHGQSSQTTLVSPCGHCDFVDPRERNARLARSHHCTLITDTRVTHDIADPSSPPRLSLLMMAAMLQMRCPRRSPPVLAPRTRCPRARWRRERRGRSSLAR